MSEENVNNKDSNKNDDDQKEENIFLAPKNEDQKKEEKDENSSKKINYSNLLNYAPKAKVQILDNISGSKYDINFKIIVIGNSGVGKSCLTLKATQDIFKEDFTSTIGFQFFSFHVKINDKIIKLQIWDTCGQEIYRSLITNFYRSTALAIICYSVTDRKSFEETEIWLRNVKANSDPNCKVFLIGNKIDLSDRVVSTEEGINLKKDHGFECFMETSAKDGINVRELFVNCALSLYKELPKYMKEKELMEKDMSSKQFNLSDDIKTEDSECSC